MPDGEGTDTQGQDTSASGADTGPESEDDTSAQANDDTSAQANDDTSAQANDDTSTQANDDTSAPPQEAFALLGNEVRAEIIRTLAEPTGDGPWKVLPFNELHHRVDPDMDSGQFNYHLQKLLGTFVEKRDEKKSSSTDGRSGYRLRPAGVNLYRAIAAGTYTRSEVLEPIDAGFDCHFCGAAVEGRYEDDQFLVQCPDCEHMYARQMLPPSVIDDERAVLGRVDQATRQDMHTAAAGVCPTCLNAFDLEIEPAAEVAPEAMVNLDVVVRGSCSHCGARRFLSVGEAVLDEPEVVAFAHERGVDVTRMPIWELEFVATDHHLEIQSRDPWSLSLSVPIEGDTLRLTIDGQLDIVETEIVDEDIGDG